MNIKELKFSDFKEYPASGGRHFLKKIGKERLSLFLSTSGNLRIMIDGTGKWINDVNLRKYEKPEKAFERLVKKLSTPTK